MRDCRKCGAKFKTCGIIDGKMKNFGSRKYCLICSPFAKHNTSKLEKQMAVDGDGKSKCKKCSRTFFYKRNAGHGRTECNSCRAHKRSVKMKQKAVDYKGGKCERCGYSKYIGAMSFHHIDPFEKDFQIGGNHNRAWGKLVLELDKCQLLCMNCHAEVHEELRNFGSLG